VLNPSSFRFSTQSSGVLRELDAFGVPFIGFGESACVTMVSAAAKFLLETFPHADEVLVQIGSAVTIELNGPDRLDGSGLFPLVRELSSAGFGRVAIRRCRHPDCSTRAVAVLSVGEALQNDITVALTPRERQVARLIAHGSQSKEVAHQLGISTHTVRRHTERVFEKLRVRNRASLASVMSGHP
jgi:DNA-binding CsgD family transcriptional regulator